MSQDEFSSFQIDTKRPCRDTCDTGSVNDHFMMIDTSTTKETLPFDILEKYYNQTEMFTALLRRTRSDIVEEVNIALESALRKLVCDS